jgi:hypothetical protein
MAPLVGVEIPDEQAGSHQVDRAGLLNLIGSALGANR